MRDFLIIAALCSTLLSTPSTHGQIDLGQFMEGEARQAIQRLEHRLPEFINPNERPPIYKILPIPSPQISPRIECPSIVPPHPQPVIIEPLPVAPSLELPTVTMTSRKPEVLRQIEVGEIVTIQGSGFGHQPGTVFVKIDSLMLETELMDWNDTLAEAQLPVVPLAESTRATLLVVAANQNVVQKLDVVLVPATDTNASVGNSSDTDVNEKRVTDPEETEVAELPIVYAGQELILDGEFDAASGSAVLRIGDMKIPAQVVEWSDSAVTVILPLVETEEIQAAELVIRSADGQIAERVPVNFSSERQ